MKKIAKPVAALLLLFNGIGAVYGGLNMMIHPDGSHIGLSPGLLERSFFDDYFIPGLILFVTNGLLSLHTFMAIILSYKKYWRPVMIQGIVLIGWLVVQMALIHVVHYFQIIMLTVGIALIALSGELYKNKLIITPGETF